MDDEVWKEFEFGTKVYLISNYGRLLNENDYEVSQRINDDGYLVVTLWNGKKSREAKIHRLVAEHFVKNKNDGTEVNHIDFDRQNNYYENLEWCSHAENIQKSVNAGRMHYQTRDISGKNNNNYGNRKLGKVYAENKDLAKLKQSRPGSKNGRCVSVRMIGNGLNKNFDYLIECANFLYSNYDVPVKLSILPTKIKQVALKGVEYLGFKFYLN